jgi:hypothetical protein
MSTDNILDDLFLQNNENSNNELISDEIIIPKRCTNCKTSLICSMLPTFINLSKIKVYISIEQCPYSIPLKNESKKITK